jgi:hypothetical protein
MAEFSKHATILHHIHVLVIGSLMDTPDFFLFRARTPEPQQPTPDFYLFSAQTTLVNSIFVSIAEAVRRPSCLYVHLPSLSLPLNCVLFPDLLLPTLIRQQIPY